MHVYTRADWRRNCFRSKIIRTLSMHLIPRYFDQRTGPGPVAIIGLLHSFLYNGLSSTSYGKDQRQLIKSSVRIDALSIMLKNLLFFLYRLIRNWDYKDIDYNNVGLYTTSNVNALYTISAKLKGIIEKFMAPLTR